ncbi:monoamine oxidase [Aspergillus saccharolyticus JOP 1030-1]|uniref:Monoamine oxidase n=1 Tax=Aspergillus saccharolyticus JOP 1030-1 TaxID=1450539 RepID=A0A318ZPI0_9EURO|nr:monoamine oxidase [Aspergillus saccharolyticus JOP 1030-1]PYH49499.1 monoamine oxidase [Aspergillus saccharolyticus JOP 1030-1]
MAAKIASFLGLFSLPYHSLVHGLDPCETISRDVIILGGGSTGTYAAIRLKDQGKTVAVVERNDYLGGHGATYYTADHTPLNFGVEGFFNTSRTREYLERLQVPYAGRTPAPAREVYLNLNTGHRVEYPPGQRQPPDVWAKWVAAIAPFGFLDEGVYRLPEPVPEALITPFAVFVQQHQLEDAVYALFSHTSGDLLEMLTLYVIQYIGVPHALALRDGYIRPVEGIAALYQRAAQELGPDVLLQSVPEAVQRADDGVQVLVRSSSSSSTADGNDNSSSTRRLLQAKQLLVTIPPLLDNLHSFALTDQESQLFAKWQYHQYWAALLNDTGLPDDVNLINVDTDRLYGVPAEPLIWRLDNHWAPGYHNLKLVGGPNFDEEAAKKYMYEKLDLLREKGVYSTHKPEIVRFASHTPVTMFVSAEEIRKGFYRKLYALQGVQSTFWTGATWASDYSTLLWGYTDEVLQQMGSS